MIRFVELTRRDGGLVWINVEHIVSLAPPGNPESKGTLIREVTDVGEESLGWHVEEEPSVVLRRIEACS